jgi:mannose-6-phosphate isomerase-like protein (cupin superfamily)
VWGRTPLVERRGDDLLELLSLDDVDAFVSRGVRRPAVRMVRAGAVLDPAEYCTPTRLGGQSVPEVVDGLKVAEQVATGATLVLQSLHRQWEPLIAFADDLMAEIRHPVQINAYLTPSEASGLRSHHDEHDVFVVQLAGSKDWVVEGLGEVSMQPGDTLYIPAGCHHSAVTTDDLSLHLTIGILRITYGEVLERILTDADVPALDTPLPLAFGTGRGADDRTLEVGVSTMLTDVVQHLRAIKVGEVVERERRRQLVPYRRGGHLSSVLTAERLTQDSVLRWVTVTPRMQPAFDDHGHPEPDRVRVLLADRVLRMPRATVAAIDALSSTPSGTRIADIPGLDPSSRLVIGRRLVLEGACVVVAG